MQAKKPIGVCDAGMGGLTVVAELQKLLPGEDIIFYGDSKRNPYGNQSAERIVEMSREIMDFIREKEAKVAVAACNTISTLAGRFAAGYDFPIIGIVQPAAEYAAGMDLPLVGVIATNATINGGAYEKLIQKHNPKTKVYGKGSTWLANIVDRGSAPDEEIDTEIKENMDKLLAMAPVEKVILGCTHYPIVRRNFERLYPKIEFIDPACLQAVAVKKALEEAGALNPQAKGSFEIYTSGEEKVYREFCEQLGCQPPEKVIYREVGSKNKNL